jgi:hypothetical protein
VVHGGRLRPLWLELFRWWADNGEQRRTCVLVLRSPRRWFVFQAEGLLQWRCEYNAGRRGAARCCGPASTWPSRGGSFSVVGTKMTSDGWCMHGSVWWFPGSKYDNGNRRNGCSLASRSLGAVDFLWQGFVTAKQQPGDRISATAHGSTWECSRDED